MRNAEATGRTSSIDIIGHLPSLSLNSFSNLLTFAKAASANTNATIEKAPNTYVMIVSPISFLGPTCWAEHYSMLFMPIYENSAFLLLHTGTLGCA
jgi:hypothetical protein